jgi:hypothetical protein
MTILERENGINLLDKDKRKFLGLLMDQSSGSWGHYVDPLQ